MVYAPPSRIPDYIRRGGVLLSIDLAEKNSAANIRLLPSGNMKYEGACRHETAVQTIEWLWDLFQHLEGMPAFVLVEDVAAGLSRTGSYKGVVQHHGRVDTLAWIRAKNAPTVVTYVLAHVWQNSLGFTGKAACGSTKSWAKGMCIDRGHEARKPAWAHGKMLEDWRDAMLISDWALAKL